MTNSFSLSQRGAYGMYTESDLKFHIHNCEAQARVRQGSARDGLQCERPQSLNPCLELTLKLVATHPPPPTTHKFNFSQLMARQWSVEAGGGKGSV